MNTTEPTTNQKTLAILTQLQLDLEKALSRIYNQANGTLQAERQARIEQEMEANQHLLERLKGLYCLNCPL